MEAWLRQLLSELKEGLTDLYGERLHRVLLFGSHARGEAGTDSDIDILVVLDEVPHYFAETEHTSELVAALSLAYDRSISCVFLSQDDWHQGEGPFLLTVRDDAIAA